MAKEVTGYLKLQIKGGQANPAPPVGPALGQRGINIMEFCKAFNEKTKDQMGKPVPVVITIYKDKKSGSKEPGRNSVGTITKEQLKKIAQAKQKDLNAFDIDEAVKIIAGSARSMGIQVKD